MPIDYLDYERGDRPRCRICGGYIEDDDRFRAFYAGRHTWVVHVRCEDDQADEAAQEFDGAGVA